MRHPLLPAASSTGAMVSQGRPRLHRRDVILLDERPHDDNGAGLDADHQSGRTGIIASLLDGLERLAAEKAAR